MFEPMLQGKVHLILQPEAKSRPMLSEQMTLRHQTAALDTKRDRRPECSWR